MFTVTIGATTTTLSCPLVETMAAEVTQILTLVSGSAPTPAEGYLLFTVGPVREQPAPAGGSHGSRPDSDPAS